MSHKQLCIVCFVTLKFDVFEILLIEETAMLLPKMQVSEGYMSVFFCL